MPTEERYVVVLARRIAARLTGLEPSEIDPATILMIIEAIFGFIEQCQERQRIPVLAGRALQSLFIEAYATSRLSRTLHEMGCEDCRLNHRRVAREIVRSYASMPEVDRVQVIEDYVNPDFSMT